MFLGKSRAQKIIKYTYTKPSELSEIDYYSKFFNCFTSFTPEGPFSSSLTSLTIPHPLQTTSTHHETNSLIVMSYMNTIEKRNYHEMGLRLRFDNDKIEYRVEKYQELSKIFYSLNYRPNDNKLIICGTNNNEVYFFQSSSVKKPLKKISFFGSGRGRGAVCNKFCDFLSEKNCLVGNDRGEIKVCSILTNKVVMNDRIGDFVRCGKRIDDNCFMCGSYNKKVKIYDIRENRERKVIGGWEEEYAVECCDFVESLKKILICCKNYLKIYDYRMLSGNKCLKKMIIHKKLITDLKRVGKDNCFLTSSLDSTVKVFSLNEEKIVKQYQFKNPVLQSCITNDLDYLFLGNNQKELVFSRTSQFKKLKLYKDEEKLVTSNYKNLINLNLIKQINKINNKVFQNNDYIYKKYSDDFKKFNYKKILETTK